MRVTCYYTHATQRSECLLVLPATVLCACLPASDVGVAALLDACPQLHVLHLRSCMGPFSAGMLGQLSVRMRHAGQAATYRYNSAHKVWLHALLSTICLKTHVTTVMISCS